MLAKQHYNKIVKPLDKNGIIYTAGPMKLMNVSSEIIREDLEYLDNQGRLSRVYGDAMPLETGKSPSIPGGYISFQTRNSQGLEQKAAITARAAALVDEGQVIALDYGNISWAMALELRERFRSLSVVTNSIRNVPILAKNPSITTILTGGILNRDKCTLVNDFPSILESIHIDVTLMIVTGTDPVIGYTGQRPSEIWTQDQMHHCASQTIVLAGSSKFSKADLLKVCSPDEVDTIVTDSGIPPELEDRIKETGVSLVIT